MESGDALPGATPGLIAPPLKKRNVSSLSLASAEMQQQQQQLTQSSPSTMPFPGTRRSVASTARRAVLVLLALTGVVVMSYLCWPQVSALALQGAETYRALLEWNGLSSGVHRAFLSDHARMVEVLRGKEEGRLSAEAVAERGILIPAGGSDQLLNAFTNLHVLRHRLRCRLPVTIAFWGALDRERIDERTQELFRTYIGNVSFLDLSADVEYPQHHRWLMPPYKTYKNKPIKYYGFKVKVFALYAAPYQHVLLMDSDSMAAQDPEALFDSPEFVQHGDMFWPDRWCTPVKLFEMLEEVSPPEHQQDSAGRSTPTYQTDSGQLLFDRRRHADVLEWLLFLNTHEEFTYRYAYGDKDSYRAAFQLAGKTKDYFQADQPLSIGLAEHSPFAAATWASSKLIFYLGLLNHPRGFVQHHPADGSIAFVHRTSKAKYSARQEDSKAFGYILRQPTCTWNRKFWHFFEPMVNPLNADWNASSKGRPGLESVAEQHTPLLQIQYMADQAATLYKALYASANDNSSARSRNSLSLSLVAAWIGIGVVALYATRLVVGFCFAFK